MTRPVTDAMAPLIAPHLEPGERLLDIGDAIPARDLLDRATTGHLSGRLGLAAWIGTKLGIKMIVHDAVEGGPESIAEKFPHGYPQNVVRTLVVTDKWVRFAVTDPGRTRYEVHWRAPRGTIARIEYQRSRIKVVDYRLHFADGSSVKVMAHDRQIVDDLAAAIAATQPVPPHGT
jgi:hypothetical protein